jgi:hypothetical protein
VSGARAPPPVGAGELASAMAGAKDAGQVGRAGVLDRGARQKEGGRAQAVSACRREVKGVP